MMSRLAGWSRRALGALGLAALIIGVLGSRSALSFATPAAPATSILQTTTLTATAAAADPVISDGFATFTLSAPGAKAISVIGSWGLSYTNVAYPMSQSAGSAVIDQLKAQDSALLANPAINKDTKVFRIYIGNRADIAYQNNIATRALFDQFHIRYQFAGSYPVSGHVWKTWEYDLFDFAPRLFR